MTPDEQVTPAPVSGFNIAFTASGVVGNLQGEQE
jgi:hypothetical protein